MSDDKTEMVVGFAFDLAGRVALVQKNRPEWMSGYLNGIGGHVEEGEDPFTAMVREFEEETSQRIEQWGCFVQMEFPEARIYFFRTTVTAAVLNGVHTVTDEPIVILPASSLGRYLHVSNLSWLLPLARYDRDVYETIVVEAQVLDSAVPS